MEMADEQVRQLWQEQLDDYQAILRFAHEETSALKAENFEALHHTQGQREYLAQRIQARDKALGVDGEAVQFPSHEVLKEITATIEAVVRLDSSNKQQLEAEHAGISNSLLRLREGRAALSQYKPSQEHLPKFLNRTV